MSGLILHRHRHLIYVLNPAKKERVRYNLKEKSMQKRYKRGNEWKNVQTQYDFFRGFSLYDLEIKEEKFKDMIDKVKKLNPRCTSVSTFISRLNDALIYENYEANGIRTECQVGWDGYSKYILSKPLEYYNKETIKFFKEHDVKVDRELESEFISDHEFMSKFINCLNQIDCESSEKKDCLDIVGYRMSSFKTLVNTYRYDMKSLLNYLVCYLKPFENMSARDGISNLSDYYRMANEIGRNVKKYPKYLKSMHDIITCNYNAYKRTYDENKFRDVMKPELIWNNKKYGVVIPECSKDIISEGTSLNHCVGSYVNKVLSGRCYIMFMRDMEHKERSLVTLEVKEDILRTAKGSCNRKISEDENKFLEKYCKKVGLKFDLI